MKKNLVMYSLIAGCLLTSSCVSKKALENCQNENNELTQNFRDMAKNYQDAKEQLAAANARSTTLQDQLEQQKKDYAALQGSLDKSLANAGQNNISIEKLVDQINER